jgi:hypothetical protein
VRHWNGLVDKYEVLMGATRRRDEVGFPDLDDVIAW